MKLTALLFMVSFTTMLFSPASAFCEETVSIDTVIIKVVYETESGYVSTDDGSFRLPDFSSMIEMEKGAYNQLISSLLSVQGENVILHTHGNVIVGVESKVKGQAYTPPYNIREKVVYSEPPHEVTTTILSWDADTYRLAVNTPSGTYCIHNQYVYSDYYTTVYEKLSGVCGMGDNMSLKAKIKYHPIEDGYECVGEIEDIDLLQ